METLFNLSGRVALITGASKGIGEASAYLMAKAGAKIVISSRRQEELDVLAQQFKAEGLDVLAVACNVGKPDDLQNLVDKTIAHYGTIDILVNNAAANPSYGPVENTDVAAFDKIMNINLKAPFELSKLVLPYFKTQKRGAIINISSIGGLTPEPFLGIYSVSKAALISMTQVMAKEWGQHNVRANVVCPGLIQTKFSEALWKDEKMLNRFLSQVPSGRMGTSEEIAALILFLASDASAYCTGSTFVADGGLTI
jgi:NAD(P)-dependent dehydrogenase (short-subunit alcohol dehydrogenase family)